MENPWTTESVGGIPVLTLAMLPLGSFLFCNFLETQLAHLSNETLISTLMRCNLQAQYVALSRLSTHDQRALRCTD